MTAAGPFISNGLGGADILHDLAVTPADGGHELLAATGRGLRLIHETAARWDTITATDEPVLRTAAAAAGGDGALAFAATWTALLRGERAGPCRLRVGAEAGGPPMAGQLPAFPDAARTIAFAPDFATSGLVWAAAGTSLHESRDGGETWTCVERGGTDDAR